MSVAKEKVVMYGCMKMRRLTIPERESVDKALALEAIDTAEKPTTYKPDHFCKIKEAYKQQFGVNMRRLSSGRRS